MSLGVLGALAVAGGVVDAATPVELRADPVDADGQVTLGDLFEDAGPASAVLVAPGPRAGASVVLDAGRVQSAARQAGLVWTNTAGVRRLVVRGATVAGTTLTPSPVASASTEALVYTRSLAAGEIVGPQDVAYMPVQAHQRPADAPDVDTVIGKAARKPLRSGQPVSGRDLSAPRVIAQGELVTVTYDLGGVRLTLQGKALAAAAAGDPVAIKNLQSGKTIQAVATGPGAASVGPEAERLRAGQFAAR